MNWIVGMIFFLIWFNAVLLFVVLMYESLIYKDNK